MNKDEIKITREELDSTIDKDGLQSAILGAMYSEPAWSWSLMEGLNMFAQTVERVAPGTKLKSLRNAIKLCAKMNKVMATASISDENMKDFDELQDAIKLILWSIRNFVNTSSGICSSNPQLIDELVNNKSKTPAKESLEIAEAEEPVEELSIPHVLNNKNADEVFLAKGYFDRLRTIINKMKDENNPEFYSKVLSLCNKIFKLEERRDEPYMRDHFAVLIEKHLYFTERFIKTNAIWMNHSRRKSFIKDTQEFIDMCVELGILEIIPKPPKEVEEQLKSKIKPFVAPGSCEVFNVYTLGKQYAYGTGTRRKKGYKSPGETLLSYGHYRYKILNIMMHFPAVDMADLKTASAGIISAGNVWNIMRDISYHDPDILGRITGPLGNAKPSYHYLTPKGYELWVDSIMELSELLDTAPLFRKMYLDCTGNLILAYSSLFSRAKTEEAFKYGVSIIDHFSEEIQANEEIAEGSIEEWLTSHAGRYGATAMSELRACGFLTESFKKTVVIPLSSVHDIPGHDVNNIEMTQLTYSIFKIILTAEGMVGDMADEPYLTKTLSRCKGLDGMVKSVNGIYYKSIMSPAAILSLIKFIDKTISITGSAESYAEPCTFALMG